MGTRDRHEDVTDVLRPIIDGSPVATAQDAELAGVPPELHYGFRTGFAPIHDRSRLPAEFEGLPNGHQGAHHFLIDDFVTAVTDGTRPPVDAWTAASYCVPGLVAHESASRTASAWPSRTSGPRRPRPELSPPARS
jgi:hypothetical protein